MELVPEKFAFSSYDFLLLQIASCIYPDHEVLFLLKEKKGDIFFYYLSCTWCFIIISMKVTLKNWLFESWTPQATAMYFLSWLHGTVIYCKIISGCHFTQAVSRTNT